MERTTPVRTLLLMLGLLAACSGTPETQLPDTAEAPVISSLAVSRWSLLPEETLRIEVFARDPSGGGLEYAWQAEAGTFSSPERPATDWTAPQTPGTVLLTCTVTNLEGQSTTIQAGIVVLEGETDRDGDGFSASDCDDLDPETYPGALEQPDGRDNDCDGRVDEGTGIDDLDGDGVSSVQGDCDDNDPSVYPGAFDPADGLDNDCDGQVDEGSRVADDDHDGFSEELGDCDDGLPQVYPGAIEEPDGLDNDCDGEVDEHTVLEDDDHDGFSEVDGDCDDTDPLVHPGAVEQGGNGVDDDCDGVQDEGTPYQDLDGDLVSVGDGDCDDRDAGIHPGATEDPDGVDNDCDGVVDEGTDLFDDDGDGYTEAQGDCDDTDAGIHPGAAETVDGLDQDCNGLADDRTSSFDDDGDGRSEDAGDCDDSDPRVHPDYPEVPDHADNDCDGVVDEDTPYADQDGDGVTVLEGDCDDSDPGTYPGALDPPEDGVDNDCSSTPLDQAPVAEVSIVAAGAGCLSVVLDGSASHDPDGDPLVFHWYLVGQAESAAITAPHEPLTSLVFDGPGPFTVGLAVSDGTLTGWETLVTVDPETVAATLCSADGDGDGFSAQEGDCDDLDPSRYPGAEEACDGVDQDCDGEEILFRDTFDLFDPLAWNLEGTAAPGTGEVLLTDLERNAAGSLFRETALPVDGFIARFEIQLEGGSGGSGMTFAVLDAGATAFLGDSGAGNGLLGLEGWGVEFDTQVDGDLGDPKSDHIAVVSASDLEVAGDPYRAPLRGDVLSMEVRLEQGLITVVWNGNAILEDIAPTWPLPEFGFVGFTASSGINTDRHHVLGVELACPGGM